MVNHSITIDNIFDEETFSYSLILIKGHIEHLIPECISFAKTLEIKNDSTNTSFKPVFCNSDFKCLINLEHGMNQIKLIYCCTITRITLKYIPSQTNYYVLPLYIICKNHDGKFQAPETENDTVASACNRILLACKLLQCLFAEKLYEMGFARKTFQLESNECFVFRSNLNVDDARKMTQLELWEYFAHEIMNSSIACSNKKYFAFLSCTKYNGSKYTKATKLHEEIVKLTEGYVAFGGGGLALLGTACLYTWPEVVSDIISRFNDQTAVDKTQFMDDSCYRSTLGGCFATTLGSALHELCHTFDLGHTEHGVMHRGFDNLQDEFLIKAKDSREKTNMSNRIRNFSKFAAPKMIFSASSSNCDINKDKIYWTQSCTTILFYHKWFNNFKVYDKNHVLQFNENTKTIKSIAGIRATEIRTVGNELIIANWVFLDKVLKYFFRIPIEEIQNLPAQNAILFVIDNFGDILKVTVNTHTEDK